MTKLLILVFGVGSFLAGCQGPGVGPAVTAPVGSESAWKMTGARSDANTLATVRLSVSLPPSTFVGTGDFEQLFVIAELDGQNRLSRGYAWQGPNKPLEIKVPVDSGKSRVARIKQIVSEDYLFVLASAQLQRLPEITLYPGIMAEASVQLERNQPL